MKAALLPLDGSELGDRAIPFATTMVRRAQCPLILVRAVSTLGVATSDMWAAMWRKAEDDLDAVAEPLRAEGLTVKTRVVDAPPAAAILDVAAQEQAELIVMSTHGRGGIGRWIYGSVTDSVLRQAPMPVLVIPAATVQSWLPEPLSTIAVPLDGTRMAEAALAPACELADILGASLLLLSIVARPRYPVYGEGYVGPPEEDADQIARMRTYLDLVAARLRTETRLVDVCALSGWPSSDVSRVARDSGADLIVMATHGYSGLKRAMLGSVSSATLQRSDVPVLLVRAAPAPRVSEPEGAAETTEAATGEPADASTTVTLTGDELELLIRAVGSRLHDEAVDPAWAEPYQHLFSKLRAARRQIETRLPATLV